MNGAGYSAIYLRNRRTDRLPWKAHTMSVWKLTQLHGHIQYAEATSDTITLTIN